MYVIPVPGGEGVFPVKFGRSVRPAFLNPYLICDQNDSKSISIGAAHACSPYKGVSAHALTPHPHRSLCVVLVIFIGFGHWTGLETFTKPQIPY